MEKLTGRLSPARTLSGSISRIVERTSLIDGGLEGQVLTKASDADRDVVWRDLPKENHIYYQNTASDTWTIQHNLGKYPSVTIVDSANTTVIGDVVYLDMNSLVVSFTAAFSGKAYMN